MSSFNNYNPIKIYTDGSCRGNPGGVGGWGAVVTDSQDNILSVISGGELSTTNNRMELTAVIKGLEIMPLSKEVQIFSDSMYVIDTAGKELIPGQNRDLWAKFFTLQEIIFDLTFTWVKGHDGNSMNEIADQLAQNASGDLKEWLSTKGKSRRRQYSFNQRGKKSSQRRGSIPHPEKVPSEAVDAPSTTTEPHRLPSTSEKGSGYAMPTVEPERWTPS
jgi:ribonuclease HI